MNTTAVGDDDVDLSDQVVIVTGGGRGLGRAFSLELARRGAAVVVNNRNRVVDDAGLGPADHVVAEIEAVGGVAAANYADASDPSAGDEMVAAALDRFGRLDGIVTSAAVTYEKSLVRADLEWVAELIDINVMGTIRAAAAASKVLYEQGSGNIVIVGSTGGLYGGHGLSAYAASKGATIAFGRSLALESVGRGVRTNVLLPYAFTQMTEAAVPDELREILSAESVAPIVAALVSPANVLNGEVIVAAGGTLRSVHVSEGATIDAYDPTPASLAAAIAESTAGNWTTARDSPAAFQTMLSDILAISDQAR